MKGAEKDYSDQLGLYYQLLIFNLINFLFVKGIELCCMPPLVAMINTACSGCRMSPRTTLDSFRLSLEPHSYKLACFAFIDSLEASCNISCID